MNTHLLGCTHRLKHDVYGPVLWTHCVRVCVCDREGGMEGATEYVLDKTI